MKIKENVPRTYVVKFITLSDSMNISTWKDDDMSSKYANIPNTFRKNPIFFEYKKSGNP